MRTTRNTTLVELKHIKQNFNTFKIFNHFDNKDNLFTNKKTDWFTYLIWIAYGFTSILFLLALCQS